ncbi:8159_t:CDS:2 [Rhizophagus irregularis]|nr:8159_t:CDS:2 [Rhizophagus irregularis]
MTFSICFWALLSQKDLCFVYLSPWLSKTLGSEDDLLLGTSFFDYFHPQEREMARHDLSEFVKKKTLSCSVTTCQYNTIQTIRKKLQQTPVSSSKSSFKQMPSQYSPASSTMTSPNFTTTTTNTTSRSNDEYMVMDVGMNVVSQDIVLAFFHSAKQNNSNCVSSTCGETEFTKEVNKLTSLMRKHLTNKVQTPPSTPFPESFFNNETPNRIFQILDRKSRNLIFTWPDSNSINSYNKYDFSRLIWDSSIIKDTSSNNIKKSNNLDVGESPNCLKLTSDKHIIETSGICRQAESVIIPYGDIVFACFQILPSATSSILGVSSAFTKPKARSAPCSPAATINSNNSVYVKRPRSPGSLSPLPSSHFYDDEIKLPHLLLNPMSPPSYNDQQQHCTQPQFSFSTTSKDIQPLPTIQHPQQPYYPHVTQTSQPRQPSPKHDYPSPTPTNHSQFHNKCESCHTSSSPEWRRGPTGHKTYSRTIARENRKREQAQREQEQRQREQREREERARERAAATVMMQRVIEPYSQYRSSNATPIPIIAPGQQHLHHQTSANSSGPLQYLPSTLPPINNVHIYFARTSYELLTN